MGVGLSKVLLVSTVPLSLSFVGVFLSNKERSVKMEDLLVKTSARISKNKEKIADINGEVRNAQIVPNREFDEAKANRNFASYLVETRKVNKCDFRIKIRNKDEAVGIDEVEKQKEGEYKRIWDELVATQWTLHAKNAINKACYKWEKIVLDRRPSKTWKGYFYWQITGTDKKGNEWLGVGPDTWWWQQK